MSQQAHLGDGEDDPAKRRTGIYFGLKPRQRWDEHPPQATTGPREGPEPSREPA